MRAKPLLLIGVLAVIAVLALRWSMQRREAAPAPAVEEQAPPARPGTPVPELPSADRTGAAPVPAAALTEIDGKPTEGDLLALMRAELTANPARALRLAQDAERRFGETPQAAERGRIAIEALVRLNDVARARDQAELFVRTYRGTDHARYVERLTGVHPRPSGPRGARHRPDGGSSP
jgi:hypothetical protein